VLRQLSQDVRAFWEFCDRATRRQDGSASREARVRLASKMVGRWPSGAPLVLAPDGDRPELSEENDFGYFATDGDGLRCPIAAHVRRSNPRDSLDPRPGSRESIEVANRHRLLRRGRQYGRFLSREDSVDGLDRDLGPRAARIALHLPLRQPLAPVRVRAAHVAEQPALRRALRQP
jgi:deferrochelatase/peroxidase EfeB